MMISRNIYLEKVSGFGQYCCTFVDVSVCCFVVVIVVVDDGFDVVVILL